MVIKFLRSPIGLGYAHRAGETNSSLPEDVKKMLVEKGFAVIVPEEGKEKPKRQPPKVHTPLVKPAEKEVVEKRQTIQGPKSTPKKPKK